MRDDLRAIDFHDFTRFTGEISAKSLDCGLDLEIHSLVSFYGERKMEAKTLEEILSYLTDTLGGDWLLAGGALVRLSFDASRGTEDVDFARMSHPELSPELSLTHFYRWLISRGLGPEWVNTAVEPFVHEVPSWKDETVLVRSGLKGKIFRPTLTLFAYLKLKRATAVDLEDIRKAIPHCPEGFDEKKLLGWADENLRRTYGRHKSFLSSD